MAWGGPTTCKCQCGGGSNNNNVAPRPVGPRRVVKKPDDVKKETNVVKPDDQKQIKLFL